LRPPGRRCWRWCRWKSRLRARRGSDWPGCWNAMPNARVGSPAEVVTGGGHAALLVGNRLCRRDLRAAQQSGNRHVDRPGGVRDIGGGEEHHPGAGILVNTHARGIRRNARHGHRCEVRGQRSVAARWEYPGRVQSLTNRKVSTMRRCWPPALTIPLW